MNALRFFAGFSAVSIGFALSACSSPSFQSAPLSDPAQIDRAVELSAEAGRIIEGSLLRDGAKVSFALSLPESGGRTAGDMHLQADCATGGADWLYADIVNKNASPVRKERRYAGGSATYAIPLPLGKLAARAVYHMDAVKQACERTPSWREVAYNKKNETQLLVEVSSLQGQADGSVRFWAAVDYPNLAYIRLYKAPYARRAGFYQADCQKQTYSLLYVYYLDPLQTVTDGGVQSRPFVLNIGEASGDSATLLSAICSQEKLAETLLPPEARVKRLPNFSALPEADAKVLAQLAQIKRPLPKQAITDMRVDGTRTPVGGSAALRVGKSGFFQQEVFVEKTPTPGVFHLTWQEGSNRTEHISFLGIIPVSQMLYKPDDQNVFWVDKLELRGDWEQMPVHGQISYVQRVRTQDMITNQSNKETEVICKVVRALPAVDLNAQLRGNAKELRCYAVGDKDDEISTYFYLEDYGFAFFQGSASLKYTLNAYIREVQ